MLPSAGWEEGDARQQDRAAPRQPPQPGWSKLDPRSRCPPAIGQNMHACSDYIYTVLDFSPLSNDAGCQQVTQSDPSGFLFTVLLA